VNDFLTNSFIYSLQESLATQRTDPIAEQRPAIST